MNLLTLLKIVGFLLLCSSLPAESDLNLTGERTDGRFFLAAMANTNKKAGVSDNKAKKARPIGRFAAMVGKVTVIRGNSRISAKKGMTVFEQDRVVTGPKSFARLLLEGNESLTVMSGSEIHLEKQGFRKGKLESVKNLIKGKLHFFTKPRSEKPSVTIKTPNAVMGVRGTSGFVRLTSKAETLLFVLSGKVSFSNLFGSAKPINLQAGFMSLVKNNDSPTPPNRFDPKRINELGEAESALKVPVDTAQQNSTIEKLPEAGDDSSGNQGQPSEEKKQPKNPDKKPSSGSPSQTKRGKKSRIEELRGSNATVQARPADALPDPQKAGEERSPRRTGAKPIRPSELTGAGSSGADGEGGVPVGGEGPSQTSGSGEPGTDRAPEVEIQGASSINEFLEGSSSTLKETIKEEGGSELKRRPKKREIRIELPQK